MSARTRKQKAALAAQSDENETPISNGSAQKPPKRSKSASAEKEVKENVYLFAPNLIGKRRPLPLGLVTTCLVASG